MVGVLALVACTSPDPSSTTTTTTPGSIPGWDLLFSEDFDGSSLDTDRWEAYHNTYGDGNGEIACLTPENVVVSGGSMTITARRETRSCPNGSLRDFTSGFIGSREVGQYYPMFGRFEMRAKLPHGQGLWPAFWLRHRDGASVAEVDMMEYFHSLSPGRIRSGLHLDGVRNTSWKETAFEAPTRTPGWHTFAVEILPVPDGIRFEFFVDGRSHHTYVDPVHTWSAVDEDETWDIAVNLAVGGDYTGHPDGTLGVLEAIDRCSFGKGRFPNCPNAGIMRAEFPEIMEVDWVRVHTPQ
jgi:beta-glucanase (GH16 family)